MSKYLKNFLVVFAVVTILFSLVLLIASTIKESFEIKEECEKTELVVINEGRISSVYDCSGVGEN